MKSEIKTTEIPFTQTVRIYTAKELVKMPLMKMQRLRDQQEAHAVSLLKMGEAAQELMTQLKAGKKLYAVSGLHQFTRYQIESGQGNDFVEPRVVRQVASRGYLNIEVPFNE